MTNGSRVLLATLCGLVIAAGVHIFAILAAPHYAENDAIARVRTMQSGESGQMVSAPGAGRTWLPLADPSFAIAACAFDLNAGPARIAAPTDQPFLSFSFHTKRNGVFFALNDRAAIRGELELVVMTQRQLDEARAAEDENEPSRDVRIVAPEEEGFVLIRVAAPFPSQRPQALAAAQAVSCTVDTPDEGS